MKKYALWVKFLCFFLAVVTLLCVAVSGLGVFLAGGMGMYNHTDYEAWVHGNFYNIAQNIAEHVMNSYGKTLSEVPQWLLEETGYAYRDLVATVNSWFDLAGNEWYFSVKDADGKEVLSSQSANVAEPVVFTFENLSATYLTIVGRQANAPMLIKPEVNDVPETVPVNTELATTEPTTVIIDAYTESFWDPNNGDEVFVRYSDMDGYTVTVGISKHYIGYRNYSGLPQSIMGWLFSARFALIAAIVLSLCLFAIVFVLLMIIAGRDPKTGEASPKGLNRIPIDLYLAAAAFVTFLGVWCAYELMAMVFNEKGGYNLLFILLICGCGVGVTTTDIGFFMAVAAQTKVPGNYWWYNSICGRVLKKIFSWIGKGFRFAYKVAGKLLSMLPVVWEWIAVGAILGIALLIICAGTTSHWYSVIPLGFWCIVFAAVVIYCGWCYGLIREGIIRMTQGNLNEKINTEWLFGSFKTIAEDLNALADVVSVAAEKQLKAERMKTELITNVSHDIKTPLTSVINYVDLLQQPHTEEEGTQYLEVLSRQSIRLKKLVEDLMDMSKASSGNMAVHIEEVDAVETVNQALGEFADKLEAACLTPVLRTSDSQLHMKADGRLTWRVLSNLLSNVVKYALPGTRVYIDLLRLDKSVVLSVKNISREELNISAEELTERFVRGDASRNTEGSGLGLNIAQSLMRLQRGSLELTVDGDLFKVTLTFPTE